MDAEIIQQQAPPSYGQLIAQGVIPPVEDFPTENPNDHSVLGNIRAFLQILRNDQSQATPNRRRRRGRHARRVLRRLRRWGLLPRCTTASTGSDSTSGQEPVMPATEVADREDSTANGQRVLSPSEMENSEAPPLPMKRPPMLDASEPRAADSVASFQNAAAPAGADHPPCVSLSSFGTTLSDVVHTLRGRLFSQRPGRSTGDPEMQLPGQHILPVEDEDDDDVLLLPLAEARAFPTQCVIGEQMNSSNQAWGLHTRSECLREDDDDVLLLPG